ncbi:MAG: hypothetical protein NTX50_17810 [Candidatus Sumerlaeota bacterium]|nr:hypothetical protein [Candidatus Sumerlaeota bacterium]
MIKLRLRLRKSPQAETLVEMMFAIGIGSLVVIGALFLTIFAERSFRTMHTQMSGQSPAARAVQSVTMKLRNAIKTSVKVYSNGTEVINSEGDQIDFQSIAGAPGVTSRIEFTASTGYLVYYPDASNTSVYDRDHGFQTFSFNNLNPMIEIKTSFKYPKYAGSNQTEPEKMIGVFKTQVWPRN